MLWIAVGAEKRRKHVLGESECRGHGSGFVFEARQLPAALSALGIQAVPWLTRRAPFI